MIVDYLSKPGFLTGYVAQTAEAGEPNTDAAMAGLMLMLEKAGISRETGLKNIAA